MMTRFPVTDHCDGRRFFNLPVGQKEQSFLAFSKWWWQRRVQGRYVPWPAETAPARAPSLPVNLSSGEVALTFIGHSTFLVQVPGLNLLTDPIFSSHAGPYGRFGIKRARPPALRIEELPRIDVVLLSHNHYDHLDLPSLRTLTRRHRLQIITTLGNKAWLQTRGFADVVELDWWQTCRPLPQLEVTCSPAQHFAARTPWDRNHTLWGGFAVRMPGVSLYFAGDSGWPAAFAEIGAKLGPFDLSLIPIGAYDPRWVMAPIHMNPDEAVQAHLAVRSRRSVSMHFGTFPLTDEGIDAPLLALAEARTRHGVASAEFDTLEFGETRLFS